MATITVSSTYAGDALKAYILKALIGGETLATKGVSVLTGIKYKRSIKKLTSSNIVKTHSCNFSATSGVTITEAILEPQKIKINESICFDDIYELWDAEDMAAGNGEQLPQSLVDGLTSEYIGQAAKEVEEAIWQGNATGSTGTIKDLFNGFEYILTNESAVSVTGTTLTTSNILTELNKVYAALPSAVAKKPKKDLVVFMSHKAAALYEMNLQAQGINTSAMGGVLSVYGIEIVPVGGLSSDNYMAMGERANFFVGTDLASDFNEVKLLDQRDNDGSDKVNFVMKAKIDVAIAYPTGVVWYK